MNQAIYAWLYRQSDYEKSGHIMTKTPLKDVVSKIPGFIFLFSLKFCDAGQAISKKTLRLLAEFLQLVDQNSHFLIVYMTKHI